MVQVHDMSRALTDLEVTFPARQRVKETEKELIQTCVVESKSNWADGPSWLLLLDPWSSEHGLSMAQVYTPEWPWKLRLCELVNHLREPKSSVGVKEEQRWRSSFPIMDMMRAKGREERPADLALQSCLRAGCTVPTGELA